LDTIPAVRRQNTQRYSLELSWWDLFKALFFGPAKTAQRMASRIQPEFEDADVDVGLL
jgi:hypothetical protein